VVGVGGVDRGEGGEVALDIAVGSGVGLGAASDSSPPLVSTRPPVVQAAITITPTNTTNQVGDFCMGFRLDGWP
jgi:hypothetical protein